MDNIYQAPQSEVVDEVSDREEQSFYVVSQRKFWILYLTTLGIYDFYWFYKHWKIYRLRTGESLWPVLRAFFSIFFVHSLFRLFRSAHEAEKRGVGAGLSGMATLYVIVTIGDRVATQFLDTGETAWWVDVIYWIPIFIIGFSLSKAQGVANFVSGDEMGDKNGKLTLANWFWILAGLCGWGYIVHSYLAFYGVV